MLSSNLTGKTLSDAEQVELSALVQPLETATDNEKLSILQEAIQQGKLSKRLADKTIRLVPNIDPYQGSTDSEPGIAMMRFSWGACGFCGALGFAEGGPLGGAAACVFCGVLAE